MALSDAVGQGRICAAMQVVDLDELKRNGALWQGRRPVLPAGRVLASGWPVLDELLGGGWPRAAPRRMVAAEAARIMATEAQSNYRIAKLKAAHRLGEGGERPGGLTVRLYHHNGLSSICSNPQRRDQRDSPQQRHPEFFG